MFQQAKSLPFYTPEAWQKYSFQVAGGVSGHIGHYRAPLGGGGARIDDRFLGIG